MERPKWIAAQDARFGRESSDAGFAIQMYKSMEDWLARVDALEMVADDFDGREFFRTDAFGDLADRVVGRCLHDLKRESKRTRGAGQAPAKPAPAKPALWRA